MIHRSVQGTSVPALGLGTWRLDGQAAYDAVERALAVGYRHVDTAQAYENEEDVGRALRDADVDREEVFLTTKIWLANLAPKRVGPSVETSLRKLKTDYVDLVLIHWPSNEVPLEQTLDAMMQLREQAKARHIGVSNFTPSLLRRAADHAPIFSIQVEYHPFLAQDDLLEVARERDMLLTAYSPIARGEVLENETLQDIGRAHGKSPVQVTLRWLLQQDHVAAIPKAAGADHQRKNFDLFDFSLSDEEMERIFALARGRRIVDPDFAPLWEK